LEVFGKLFLFFLYFSYITDFTSSSISIWSNILSKKNWKMIKILKIFRSKIKNWKLKKSMSKWKKESRICSHMRKYMRLSTFLIWIAKESLILNPEKKLIPSIIFP
jgi:hypothetical protein